MFYQMSLGLFVLLPFSFCTGLFALLEPSSVFVCLFVLFCFHFLSPVSCYSLLKSPLWSFYAFLLPMVNSYYICISEDFKLRPQMKENILGLFFWVWVTSLNIILFRSIYLPGPWILIDCNNRTQSQLSGMKTEGSEKQSDQTLESSYLLPVLKPKGWSCLQTHCLSLHCSSGFVEFLSYSPLSKQSYSTLSPPHECWG